MTTTDDAKRWCSDAVNAIDALNAFERFTTFSQWYNKEHNKLRSAARKAVIVVESIATSDEEREMCRLFLSNLRNKVTRCSDLRNALATDNRPAVRL